MESKENSFFVRLVILFLCLLFLTLSHACSSDTTEKDDQILFIGDDIAVAKTEYGKVRGFILRGIYTFRGIPYGADTSGKNRFMPPQKPEPWTDVYPAIWWGASAPQNMNNRYANPYASFVDHWNYDEISENCLKINVWTPAINDGKKRPVLLWLHGGGFRAGNGIEQDGYNGENLSRKGDIVFCSINHRLGPLGFSNFASVGDEKFANSGNVGMMDIVAALQWVHNNISNFCGDPDNVTTMGQSGGGAKVTTLTAMPSAKGLFHKAVVLSGASIKSGDKDYSEKLGEYILKEAGLSPDQITKLQDIPWEEYYRIAEEAAQKLRKDYPSEGFMGNFSPCVDGTIIPQHPYYPEPSPSAANVPMLICSTFNELSPSRDDPELEKISLEEVKKKLKERMGWFSQGLGEKSSEVVDAYARVFPDKKPVEIWSMIIGNRQRTIALADAKAKQPKPVYLAWFGWQPPLFNNRMRAFHCLDISFWFYNTDLMLSHSGGGARPRKLAAKMADSLINFMKTGNPNGGGLPEWPAYSTANGETMILDDKPEVKNDPDRDARITLPKSN
jgi:para-nitrobenzyl esterase